jgi:hypothetical protein
MNDFTSSDPVFPSNQTHARNETEAERMWRIHEEALADQPDELNPASFLLWPLKFANSLLKRFSQ